LKPRECFPDNGVIGEAVAVEGTPDVPCGGVAKQTLGAVYCVPPVDANFINAAFGLPSPGRIRVPGITRVDP
jgi:hypothetical protein